jgi:hypothetical protein
MQITKTTLRRIIKEELDAVMNEGNDMEAIEATADAFRKSPQIMALVDQALENPEVIAALEQTASQEDLAEISNLNKAKIAGGVAKAGLGAAGAGGAGFLGTAAGIAALKSIVGPIAGMNAAAAAGISVGMPLLAVGALVYLEFSRRQREYQTELNEDRAEHVAGIEAKIKRLEAEVDRAQERRDEIGYDPAADDPRTSKTYRELGVRIENMEDKLDTLRKQREELSKN